MKIRALIVDDERPARVRLRQLLQDETDCEVVGECSTGQQAVALIRKEEPAVVFLDVQMPKLNGFDVCASLSPEQMPLIVFVTAFDQYALKAFEVHAVDYLLKPFDKERLQKTLRRVRELLKRGQDNRSELAALLEDLRNRNDRPDRLALRVDGRVVLLRAREIDWIEADGNYVRIQAGPQKHHVRETMTWFEEELPVKQFVRISRSVIVNLDRIRELQPLFYGDYTVILHDGTRLTLSRNFRERFEKALGRAR